MADIAMCQNEKCAVADWCYRFTAPPNQYHQGYLLIETEVESKEECQYYWEVEE
jgi:hypothetical protein